jgi:hypothetical protein
LKSYREVGLIIELVTEWYSDTQKFTVNLEIIRTAVMLRDATLSPRSHAESMSMLATAYMEGHLHDLSLEELPDDVLFLILPNLPLRDIQCLARASHHMHARIASYWLTNEAKDRVERALQDRLNRKRQRQRARSASRSTQAVQMPGGGGNQVADVSVLDLYRYRPGL